MQSAFDPGETDLLRQGIDVETNWIWAQTKKETWNVVSGRIQQFYERWRHPSASNLFKKPPYELSIGTAKNGRPLLPLQPKSTSKGRILVTTSYDDMFHRLLHIRMDDPGNRTGVVITGQPGIGKTNFLKFMLVRLISAHQVVLLCCGEKLFLFYAGQTYCRPAAIGFGGLPQRLHTSYYPVWALIDMDFQERAPGIESHSDIWPIQAASPKPQQWRSWSEQFGAAVLGMPLWNIKDLMMGLRLQPGYDKFRTKLEQSLPLLGGSTLSTTDDEIDAALQVLQEEAEKGKEDYDEMGDSIRASVAGQGGIVVHEASQPVPSVDDALKTLVQNAIEEFGLAARDVYHGVFDLRVTRRKHAQALHGLDYSKLRNLVVSFSTNQELDAVSDRIVVVYPRLAILRFDYWEFDFKSIRIANEVVELMRLAEDNHLWNMYHLLDGITQGSGMAGWIFDARVHRMLSGGWQLGSPVPRPIRMATNLRDPPAFFTGSPSSPPSIPDTLLPSLVPPRTVVRVSFIHELNDVTLDENRYYIPTASNNPLFDSFTIIHGQGTVVISVFQITISPKHEGSSKGYLFIRQIMARVRELLKKEGLKATIQVAYILVCPSGEQHEWQMPNDWNKSVEIHDHRGDAFCIFIPVPDFQWSLA